MSKKLQSLLELAIVIGGLAGTPVIVVASFGTIVATVQAEPAAPTLAQDVPTATHRTRTEF
jgi:hypothetical protein